MSNWFIHHIYNMLSGLFFAVIGYFAEINGAIHVMWVALALDLLSGILRSVIVRKQRFSMKRLFVAIGRAIAATVFIALLFAMDKEMNQSIAESYNIAAWIISGFYAWSISENMDELLGGKIFRVLKLFIEKRVENNTGINLKDVDSEDNN